MFLVDVGPDHYARLEAVKMFTLLMRHAGNGRRYVQDPAGARVNEPRGVRARARAFEGALRYAPCRLNAVAVIHATD